MAARTSYASFGGGIQAISTLREVARVRADLMPVLPKAVAGDDVVVLVHGFMATAGVFRPLRARLERDADARVATFSHAPGLGVRRIAEQLANLVDRIPHGTRIHLVGHSLGGIVARWYVQEMGGDARVAQTISIATPFGGARIAAKLRVLVGNDLHTGSDVLTRLRDGAAGSTGVPHLSIAGTEDRMVSPPDRARFTHGELVVLEGRGHNQLLFDREAIGLVVGRVIGARLA
jgi:triacylglycerol esterase/lipase EstA (alpha/beta hydrolase family)